MILAWQGAYPAHAYLSAGTPGWQALGGQFSYFLPPGAGDLFFVGTSADRFEVGTAVDRVDVGTSADRADVGTSLDRYEVG